jgi:hypothetical protein
MELSFSYTFADYQEAAKAVRRGSRTKKPGAAAKILIALTILVCAALLIVGALIQSDTNTGDVHPTKLSTFLLTMIPWALVIGAGSAVGVQKANPNSRRSIGSILLILLVTGLCVSFLFAEAPVPPGPPAPLRDVWRQLAPWFVLLIGCFVVLVVTLKALYRRMWDGMQHLRLPHTARFSEERVEIENPTALLNYKWTAFLQFRETTNLFVLQLSKFTFHMIPKRACKTIEEVDSLRRLLEQHVANAEPVTFGFAVVAPKTPPPLPRMVEPLPPRTMN